MIPAASGGRKTSRSGWWASPRLRLARASAMASMHTGMGRRAVTSAAVSTTTFTWSRFLSSPAAGPRKRGASAFQTVSAMIRCPSAVGWIAVVLVEPGNPGDAFEQEGYEHRVVRPRELRIERAKAVGILATVVGKGLHPREHELRRRRLPAGAHEDGLDVRPRGRGILGAQAVVGSGLDHEHGDRLPHQPVDPPEGPGRGLAADPRVDHAVRQAARPRSAPGSARDRTGSDRARSRR